MATYVLAHGAWQGGWAWRFVAPQLRAAGHTVFTPTYTGLGERAHLGHPEINLDTHINDVVGVFEAEELDGVILCGHSYGGMVITGVAERLSDRISDIVYIDAFVPTNGESSFSRIGDEAANAIRAAAKNSPEGWRVPVRGSEIHGFTNPEMAELYDRRVLGHPVGCMEQAIFHSNPWTKMNSRTYIHCTRNDPSPFGPIAESLKDDPSWDLHRVDCGHQIQLDMPDKLVEIVLPIA